MKPELGKFQEKCSLKGIYIIKIKKLNNAKLSSSGNERFNIPKLLV